MDQRCYYGNQSVHGCLDKVNNAKDSKIKKSKPKTQELKTSNSNNSSRPDLERNAKISNKAQNEKKKYWRWEERNKKNSNSGISASGVNKTSNSNGKKHIQINLSQVTYLNYDKKGHYSNNYLEPLKPIN